MTNPSETKLVETPRTDAAVWSDDSPQQYVRAEIARQLERELIERNEILAEAREEVSSMESAWRNDNRLNATALASLADELRQTELKGCYRLIDELKEDLRLAREDAERYRWLKAHHLQTGVDSWIRTGDDLEEAIDAALNDAAK